MKKSVLLLVYIALLTACANAFQTSSESGNPFNRYMAPVGNVNLYSGFATYSLPLADNVVLSYSSNVHTNVRAKNSIAPTGMCGLGWNLEYGAIACNHNGTKTHDDDDFVWKSPAGFGSKIIRQDGGYVIEGAPYLRIEPIDHDGDGVYEGWIITQVDGTKLKYGNLDLPGNRNATRWTFAWGDYVGTGMSGSPVQHPYQWDLSSVEDVYGNETMYKYQQEDELLKVGDWTSPVSYTKSSYPHKIVFQSGRWVLFELESKGNEAYDPYTYQVEPDGFLEIVESQRLAKVKVFATRCAETPIHVTSLLYSTINGTELGADYMKSLLKTVLNYNGAEDRLLNETNLQYYDNFSQADETNTEKYLADYNYGALASVATSTGGKVEFKYERSVLDQTKLKRVEGTTTDLNGPYSGMLSDGVPYIIHRGTTKSSLLWVYIWNGSKWVTAKKRKGGTVSYFTGDDLGNTNTKAVYPGYDQFIVVTGSKEHLVSGFRWNGKEFEVTGIETDGTLKNLDLHQLGNPNGKSIQLSNQHLVVTTGSKSHLVSTYFWDGNNWCKGTFQLNELGNPNSKTVYLGNTHMLVRTGSSQHLVSGYQWANGEWVSAKLDGGSFNLGLLGNPNGKDIYVSRNHFFVVTGSTKHLVQGYTWDGSGWKTTMPLGVHGNTNPKKLALTDEHLIMRTGSKKQFVSAYYWNGNSWQIAQTNSGGDLHSMHIDQVGNSNGKEIYSVAGEHLAIVTGSRKHLLNVYHWEGSVWKTNTFQLSTLNNPNGKTPYLTNDQLVVRTGSSRHLLCVYIWDGRKWIQHRCLDNLGENDQKEIIMRPGYFVASDKRNAWFFRKFQDNYSEKAYTFVVKSKVQSEVVGASSILTEYSFGQSTGSYDTRTNAAKFNETILSVRGNGRKATYFYNDTDADGQNAHARYDELDGVAYKTTTYREGEVVPVTSAETEHVVYEKDEWPPSILHRRIKEETTIKDGVRLVTDVLAYNATNGLPAISRNANSDGIRLLTKKVFAFEEDAFASGMGPEGSHMLTQPCQTIVYAKSEGDAGINPQPREVRNATAMSWSNKLGVDAWVPEKTYVWRAQMDVDGAPKRDFKYFDFSAVESVNKSNGWQLTGVNPKYNARGQLLQQESPNGGESRLSSVTIYRPDNSKAQATIVNAKYLECAAFTCDYSVDEDGYFDKENGWEKSGSVLKEPPVSFLGDKAVYVDLPPGSKKFGPTRNVAVLRNTDYIMSAWVLVNEGTLKMHGDYRHRDADDEIPLDLSGNKEDFSVSAAAATQSPHWQYIELRIPASKDLTASNWTESEWGARVYVGSPNGVTAYIQDVRFFPADAQVNTVYLDEKWVKPQISVDANGKPGRRVSFDDFGRPIKWDKARIADDEFKGWVKMEEREYHMVTELPDGVKLAFVGALPDYFEVGKEQSLGWVADQKRVPELYLSVDDGANWEATGVVTQNASIFGSFTWSAPSKAAGKTCRLKVTDQKEKAINLVTAPFMVGYNNKLSIGISPAILKLTVKPEGSGYYKVSDVVRVATRRKIVRPGYEYDFVKWEITEGTGVFGDENQAVTSFTITSFDNADHVAIRAVYKLKLSGL